MHILGTHMHIHTKYEVSILNPVARRAVHRCQQCRHRCWTTPTPDDNYARRTNHDYIGSFGRIPNEPKSPEKSEHFHSLGSGSYCSIHNTIHQNSSILVNKGGRRTNLVFLGNSITYMCIASVLLSEVCYVSRYMDTKRFLY